MKCFKPFLGFILVLFFMAISPSVGFSQDATPANQSIRVVKNVPYNQGPAANASFQSLDLYLPEGKSHESLVVFVHGGGWRAGDKSMDGLDTFVQLWINQGVALASINYRLSPTFKHPAQMEDVASAFAWLRANAGHYGWDPNNMFLAGHSSGAHLATLLALDPKYLQEQKLTPKDIRGVIAISGIYNLGELFEPGISPTRVELTFPKDRKVLDDASPIYHVGNAGPDTPPLLIAYSDNDMFGLNEQAKALYDYMLQRNLPVQMVKLANRDHSGSLTGISKGVMYKDPLGRDVQPVDDMLGPEMTRFVKLCHDGTFVPTFHATWTDAGIASIKKEPRPDMKVLSDVPYLTGPGADPKLNALNLYLPEGKTKFPLIFYVHGGSWRGGTDETPPAVVDLFLRQGWGIASTNYRLSPAVQHPAHIQDVSRAFAWVYKNAEQYGIDRDRIVVMGESAGAHLIALMTLDPRYLEEVGVPMKVIRGVITTSGMYDVPRWYEPSRVPSSRMQAFGSVEAMEDASPIKYVNSQAPPFLISFTDRDAFMQPQQANWFYSALLKQGVHARMVQVIEERHQQYLYAVAQPLQPPTNISNDVLGMELVEFINEVLGTTPGNHDAGSTSHMATKR